MTTKPPVYQGMDVPSTTPVDIYNALFDDHEHEYDEEENEDDRPLNFERE